MAKRNVYYVSPNQQKGWSIKKQGGKRAIQTFQKKDSAVQRAREIAKSQKPSQLKIQKQNGVIQTEHTYGNDPHPPKG